MRIFINPEFFYFELFKHKLLKFLTWHFTLFSNEISLDIVYCLDIVYREFPELQNIFNLKVFSLEFF